MRAWENFLDKQDSEIGQETVDKWLRSLKVVCFDACNLYLEAKDYFYVLWFEEHVRHKVKSSLLNNNNKLIKVHINVFQNKNKEDASIKNFDNFNLNNDQFLLKLPVNSSNKSFESFLSFSGNELAYRLLKEVILEIASIKKEDRVLNFNPIYLYGPSGSGKTHLMLASINELKKCDKKVIYVEASLFTDHVVSAIRKSEMEKFRSIYRNIDALFIDGIDTLSGKNATQEEFFHTFNTLHLEGKLIVIASSYNPQQLKNIEHRLTSRFEWGIVVPVKHLDEDNVECILNKHMQDSGFILTKEAVHFLYKVFRGNLKSIFRSLEILTVRVHKSKAILSNILDCKEIQELLKDLVLAESRETLTPVKIVQKVSDYYGVRIEDVLGKSQAKDCVFPRQLAMYLCRENLHMPYIKIGSIFSRDHSTVMSSVKQINTALNDKHSELSFSIKQIVESFNG